MAVRENPHRDLAAAWRPPATLTGPAYCSAEVFQQESERIFRAGWFCVGREEGAPAANSLVVDPVGESRRPTAVDTWEGFVWVSVAPDPPPLRDHLARWADADPFQWERYGIADLVAGRRSEYRVAANWKLIVENYNECLHCPTVHPSLTELIPVYRSGEVEERPGQDHGNLLRDGATSFTFSGASGLPTLPGLSDADVGIFNGTTILPNLIVNMTSDTVSTFLLLPAAPDSTTVVSHYLFRPETVAAPGFDPSPVVEFRDTLAREDWAVCERAQLGNASRAYAAGGILPYADRYIRAFHTRYRRMMADNMSAWA
jgi:Rieske 2Fe-2S family protein